MVVQFLDTNLSADVKPRLVDGAVIIDADTQKFNLVCGNI